MTKPELGPMPKQDLRLMKRLAWAAAPLLLFACMGGTGSDTENGITAKVFDAGGAPAEGVTLAVHSEGFRPDSGDKEDPILEATNGMRSDFRGYVHFRLKEPGNYVIEVMGGQNTLSFDTLKVADLTGHLIKTIRLGDYPTSFRGKLSLESGLKFDSGFVFVRGTGHVGKIDTGGRYSLGTLPGGALAMGIGVRYHASPRRARVVELKFTDTSKVLPLLNLSQSYRCRDLSKDSLASLSSSVAWRSDPANLIGLAADTNNTKAALRSCDSLAKGTLVSLRLPVKVERGVSPRDSVEVPYLVVKDTLSRNAQDTLVLKAPVLVRASCVEGSTGTITSFGLRPESFSGNDQDYIVDDVRDSCIRP